jgi:hypothetical protein
MCPKPDGHWKVASDKSLPIGLKVKANVNNNNRGRGKGKGKDKHKKDFISVGKMF